MNPSAPEVAILIEPSTAWGRGLIQGITNFARRHGPWRFLVDSYDPPGGRAIPRGWKGHGVIGRIDAVDHKASLNHLHCPVVNVGATTLHKSARFPRVAADYEQAGMFAAEHLLDRGLENIACISGRLPQPVHNGVHIQLSKPGYQLHSYVLSSDRLHNWPREQNRLIRWLKQLPKPVGIVAVNDLVARFALQSSVRNGLRVPEDVAVLGLTNDELLCEMCSPSLSSVAFATERQGYEAARMLNALMHGNEAAPSPRFIEPIRVIERQSTNVLAVSDAVIADAIKFIRDHAHEPIGVEDVLAKVALSRRSFETRFVRCIGRTPAAEIRRLRIEKIKHLLQCTDMKMVGIADASGFATAEYMSSVFRKYVGKTPRGYRLWIRSR